VLTFRHLEYPSIARIMPSKSMLLRSLVALYICNGIAAGDLGFDETPFNPWRAALQLDNRRALICDNPTWALCPDGDGCCAVVSQCAFLNGLPVCNIPCSAGSTRCPDGNCCLEGYACSGTHCVLSASATHVGKFFSLSRTIDVLSLIMFLL
jgi:hypothetical protein